MADLPIKQPVILLPSVYYSRLIFATKKGVLHRCKQERSAQTILDTVLPKLHDGCIILCHNNGFKIKEYLPTLIETAQSQGYEFVTVSELRLSGDTIIDVNGVQKAA
ncbi:MAG: hypothetical protein IJN83_06565 [Clostridia bacterium]|nr:hypothetical protein [Clostridia bacterium]